MRWCSCVYSDFQTSGAVGDIGGAQITMEVLTNNNTSYDIPVTYNSTKNKDILSFIEILKNSNLLIEDSYNIFSLYPETNLDFIDFIDYSQGTAPSIA